MNWLVRKIAKVLGYRVKMTDEEYKTFVDGCRRDAQRNVEDFCESHGIYKSVEPDE